MATGEWFVDRYNYIKRPRYGDKDKRDECCGKLPNSFDEDLTVDDILELKNKLILNFYPKNFKKYYCCEICGQEWVDEPLRLLPHSGHGNYCIVSHVTKK